MNASSYLTLGERCFGRNGASAVLWSLLGLLGGAFCQITIIVVDLSEMLLAQYVYTAPNATPARPMVFLIVLLLVYPLCLPRQLLQLSFTSSFSVGYSMSTLLCTSPHRAHLVHERGGMPWRLRQLTVAAPCAADASSSRASASSVSRSAIPCLAIQAMAAGMAAAMAAVMAAAVATRSLRPAGRWQCQFSLLPTVRNSRFSISQHHCHRLAAAAACPQSHTSRWGSPVQFTSS